MPERGAGRAPTARAPGGDRPRTHGAGQLAGGRAAGSSSGHGAAARASMEQLARRPPRQASRHNRQRAAAVRARGGWLVVPCFCGPPAAGWLGCSAAAQPACRRPAAAAAAYLSKPAASERAHDAAVASGAGDAFLLVYTSKSGTPVSCACWCASLLLLIRACGVARCRPPAAAAATARCCMLLARRAGAATHNSRRAGGGAAAGRRSRASRSQDLLSPWARCLGVAFDVLRLPFWRRRSRRHGSLLTRLLPAPPPARRRP